MGRTLAAQDEIDTGTRRIREPSHWQQATLKRQRGFDIKQGIRRRHPQNTLSRFGAITDNTDKAESVWEKAFEDEEERAKVDQQYAWNGSTSLLTNQMGVVKAALDNYTKSKGKLERVTIVGV